MLFKKILNIFILVIINLFLVSKVESQQFKPFPEDTSLGMSVKSFNNIPLKDYPMPLVNPSMKILIVRLAKDAEMIFDKNKWKLNKDEPKNISEYGNQLDLQMKSLNKESVSIRFNLKQNAIMQLQNTIIESLKYAVSPVQTTWNGTGEYPRAKVIPIDNASFIANYGEKAPDNDIMYSVANLRIECINLNKTIEQDEIIKLAKDPLKLFFKITKLYYLEKPENIKLSVSFRSYNAAVVNWTVEENYDDENSEKYDDYWVRIDTEAGEISILEDGKILVGNIPKEGTRIHCYAINAEGTGWRHNSIFLSGDPRKQENIDKPKENDVIDNKTNEK